MKASVKLREDEGKPPLLRAKFPVSILSLPFVASFSATPNPRDLSFHLLSSPSPSSSFPLPTLKLTCTPNPNPNPNFSLSLRSSLRFPIRFSLHLSPTAPTFSLTFKPSIGDFSFTKKSTSSSSPSNPNPKEDPVSSPPMAVKVSTALPAGNASGVRVRWAVHLPPDSGRLPYLTLDKISVERTEGRKDEEGEEKKEWGEKDFAAMGGMCFWMMREVEELRKENASIMEEIESVRVKVLGNAAASGGHGRTGGSVTDKGVRK
ncbi:uncharacterized protein M6B38_183815 [Iris pallida]|uniref:Uncharacterized protein n=1 Tax=Iris pallida TaxID=29817 RepID=A0AAX6EKI7_IRIPA|nr:uncharacterized protein M6B38_183815 [Iris pallida]